MCVLPDMGRGFPVSAQADAVTPAPNHGVLHHPDLVRVWSARRHETGQEGANRREAKAVSGQGNAAETGQTSASARRDPGRSGAASRMVHESDSAVHSARRKHMLRYEHRLRRTVRGFSMIHFSYLDPGTGTLIVQALLGGTAGVAVLFKTKRSRLARKNKPVEAEQASGQGESDEAAAPIPSAD
jgi:hypothetical protein